MEGQESGGGRGGRANGEKDEEEIRERSTTFHFTV